MKHTRVEYIGKALIILGVILLAAVFPGCIPLSMLIRDPRIFEIVFHVILITFFVTALLVLIFMIVAGDMLRKKK